MSGWLAQDAARHAAEHERGRMVRAAQKLVTALAGMANEAARKCDDARDEWGRSYHEGSAAAFAQAAAKIGELAGRVADGREVEP